MEDRMHERIDRYLRKEMSGEESLLFEQEALNNPDLRREIELTYRIKRRLADRQHKLFRTAHWERKRRIKHVCFVTMTSVAAILVVGFFLNRPVTGTSEMSELLASANVSTSQEMKKMGEEAVVSVKQSISQGKEEVAIAEVTRLEKQDVIPTLNEVSDGKFIMNHTLESADADALCRDAYELHWLRIKSLITIGKTEQAVDLLRRFVLVEGKYRVAADSLLREMGR
ncbi:MAG: hypothetical protein ACI4B5_06555 [Bacteroidaceae bacterium]